MIIKPFVTSLSIPQVTVATLIKLYIYILFIHNFKELKKLQKDKNVEIIILKIKCKYM